MANNENKNPESKEIVYGWRMYLEASNDSPCIYDVLDDSVARQMKRDLNKYRKLSGEGYDAWKTKYLAEQKELLKDRKFVTVEYMFIGYGRFREVMVEDDYPKFKNWIDGNGAAFADAPREATEEEIEIYIAKCALDEFDEPQK